MFVNKIDNYIYLEKKEGEQKDGADVYKYTSGDALLCGGEVVLGMHPVRRLHWRNSFSYVDARQINQKDKTQKYLPFTPMPRLVSNIHYDVPTPKNWFIGDIHASIEMEYNLRQDHYLETYDTETSTLDYMLFNALIGMNVQTKKAVIAKLHIGVENIFDKAYQNHLSRLKYADVNNVTGKEGVYEMGRNFVFNLEVPMRFRL